MSSRELTTTSGSNPVPAIRRGGRQERFLSQAAILEEGGSLRLIRLALYTVAVVTVAFIVWASVTKVDEMAVSFGQVVPTGQVQVVQHLEGGIVDELLVEDGDVVSAGDLLVRLRSEASQGDLEQMLAREASLRLQAERLRAFGLGLEPNFAFIDGYPGLKQDQQIIYDIELGALESRRAVLLDQIDQRLSELSSIESQQQTARKQLGLLNQELEMRKTLYDKGLGSKIQYLDIQRQVTQVTGDLNELNAEHRRVSQSLAEVRSRLVEMEATRKEQALSEMGKVTAELAQVRESLRRSRDRVTRLEVRSPVDGVVKGMTVHTPGAVVPPGGVVTDVVPLDKKMIVEVKIRPRDIGHLEPGMPAQIKFTTYDYSRYGAVTGELKSISATTFLDEKNGDPYYKGLVSLDRNYVGFDPQHNRVLPGMTAEADVKTGKKTLLAYFLKPIYTTIDAAFHER